MFSIKGVLFRNMIDLLHNTFGALHFKLDDLGFHSTMINTDGNISVDITLSKEDMITYEAPQYPLLYSIPLIILYENLGYIKKRDIVVFKVIDGQKATISVSNDGYSSVDEYTLTPVPNVELVFPTYIDGPIQASAPFFQEVCKMMPKGKNGFITIRGSAGKGIEFERSTSFIVSKQMRVGEWNDESVELQLEKEMFKRLQKIVQFSDTIYIYIGKHQTTPLKFEARFGHVSHISFYIKGS